MNEWIPAISTTALFGVILWLSRSLISTRLTKTVQHEFDNKLEIIRTDLRKSEESFSSELRLKEDQFNALRNSVFSGLVSRQATLDKRRLEAIEHLWSSIMSLASGKSISYMMAGVNFGFAVEKSTKDPKVREMFDFLATAFNLHKLAGNDAMKSRPFVSPIAWALFSAYQAIILFDVYKLHMLKSGINIPELLNTDIVANLIKAALPHHTAYINKYGAGAYHHLLDEIETRLLEEFQKMMHGVEYDKTSIEQAAEILKMSKLVMDKISESKHE